MNVVIYFRRDLLIVDSKALDFKTIFTNKWIFTSLEEDNKNINLKNTSIIENNSDCFRNVF